MAVLMVGHVTKEGSIAGPRLLEHLVDVVVTFEGGQHSRLRLVRAVKNRFRADGRGQVLPALSDVRDRRTPGRAGCFCRRGRAGRRTAITVTLEGGGRSWPKVQALVAASALTPRRESRP